MILDAALLLKLVSAFFYQIFIFLLNDSPLKTMKNVFFISSKNLFSFSRYSNSCNFFPSFPVSRFKRTNGSGIIYDVINWLTKICRSSLWNNSTTALHYIIKLGQITNKGIFLNLLHNLKSDCSLVPEPFCFW